MGHKNTAADLRRARDRADETQAQFCRRFGIDRSTYTGWEKHGPPKEGTAPLLIEYVLAELSQQR